MGLRQKEIRLGLAKLAIEAIESINVGEDHEKALGKQYARLIVLKVHPELEKPVEPGSEGDR